MVLMTDGLPHWKYSAELLLVLLALALAHARTMTIKASSKASGFGSSAPEQTRNVRHMEAWAPDLLEGKQSRPWKCGRPP